MEICLCFHCPTNKFVVGVYKVIRLCAHATGLPVEFVVGVYKVIRLCAHATGLAVEVVVGVYKVIRLCAHTTGKPVEFVVGVYKVIRLSPSPHGFTRGHKRPYTLPPSTLKSALRSPLSNIPADA